MPTPTRILPRPKDAKSSTVDFSSAVGPGVNGSIPHGPLSNGSAFDLSRSIKLHAGDDADYGRNGHCGNGHVPPTKKGITVANKAKNSGTSGNGYASLVAALN